MYVIIWEFQVKAEHVNELEETYSGSGAWARLFRNSNGFVKTELLHDESQAHRYVTIDWWRSPQEYEAFLMQWGLEYAAIDRQCERLTEHETLLGKWQTILSGIR
jgi:heme-degrading monooxygenase HmoA